MRILLQAKQVLDGGARGRDGYAPGLGAGRHDVDALEKVGAALGKVTCGGEAAGAGSRSTTCSCVGAVCGSSRSAAVNQRAALTGANRAACSPA